MPATLEAVKATLSRKYLQMQRTPGIEGFGIHRDGRQLNVYVSAPELHPGILTSITKDAEPYAIVVVPVETARVR